jgi:hypothetical protein
MLTLLAFSISIGGSGAARADESESLSVPVQDTVLVPVRDLKALEQRLAYLETAVAALREAAQHVNTHQLCVSDADGAETCVTKMQLDAILAGLPHAMETDAPAAIAGEVNSAPVEATPIATPPDNSQLPPGAGLNKASQEGQQAEETATIAVTAGAEMKNAPDPELSSAESVGSAEDTEAGSSTVAAQLSQAPQPGQPGTELSATARELNVVPEHEIPAGADLP